MVTASHFSKSTISNTRSTTVSAPFLLSPISVAHRSQMMDSETGRYSTGNAIRDQWVANLHNKRMTTAAGTGELIGNGNRLASSSTPGNRHSKVASVKRSSRGRNAVAAESMNAAQLSAVDLETSQNTRQLNAHRQNQIAMNDADTMALEQSFKPFHGMDCFDLEPSFSGLISSLDAPFTPATITNKGKDWPKSGTKTGSKKRTIHCLAHHADQPKPRTPHRKLNFGSAASDIFGLDYYSVVLNASGFPEDESPYNISVDASCSNTGYHWDQDLDFSGAGEYADTFLDSATSPFAETPFELAPQRSNISNSICNKSKECNDEQDASSKSDYPKSIRTSSIGQEGISNIFEQTDLDDKLYHLVAMPLDSARKSPFSGNSCVNLRPGAAASATLDEFYGGTPATLASFPIGSSSRPDAATARKCTTPCDQKQPLEFETLMDDHNCTDIDQELDGFYLDTIEAIGNDID